ncbi:MAG TPA: LytTR family transcriptional regulator DNA-binding domain-containing protein [Chitinophagales bacterium]|nr:LytTR family transcriptional regulator DNA-binding domain-containing protein [Chitinophagales bacterium]
MVKVILVDDDANDLDSLSCKLQKCNTKVTIVATCSSVQEAVKAIHQYQPDVVFTDIEMPVLSGLQLLDFFDEGKINFELIFTTSYSEFAVRAFQLSAIDYLVKPVDEILLQKALLKVGAKKNLYTQERTDLLKENLATKEFKRIAIPYTGGVNFVDVADMVYLKADNVYTAITLKNTTPLTVTKSLKEFDNLLPRKQFFRCHRSYLVNMYEVKEYVTAQGGELLMKNGSLVPVARDRKEEFIAMWQQFKV